jgi:hypothetical protein
MKPISSKMETFAIFDDTGKHRYKLTKCWAADKKTAAILMLYPCSTDAEAVQMDLTTTLCVNNLAKLDYGTASIINIFSKINLSLGTETEPTTPEHDEIILQTVQESD